MSRSGEVQVLTGVAIYSGRVGGRSLKFAIGQPPINITLRTFSTVAPFYGWGVRCCSCKARHPRRLSARSVSISTHGATRRGTGRQSSRCTGHHRAGDSDATGLRRDAAARADHTWHHCHTGGVGNRKCRSTPRDLKCRGSMFSPPRADQPDVRHPESTVLIRSGVVRGVMAFGAAALLSLAAFGVLVRLPIWLIGTIRPWEYRSSDDHFDAFVIEIGSAFLTLAALLALTKILYKSWSPLSTESFRDSESRRDSRDA